MSKKDATQLDLALPQPEVAGALNCQGIFTANYLRGHFIGSVVFPSQGEIEALYKDTRSRWEKERVGLGKRGEAYTRSTFLDPLLVALGWHFIPEENLPHCPTRKKPDYCLFPDAEQRQLAAAETTGEQIFRRSDSVLEAKKWNTPLEEASKTETPNWFPSEQVQDYLRHAKDASGIRFFNWAILTDGQRWRLYCEQAAGDAYFEFVLARGDTFCSLDDFRFFVALFRPQAFVRTSGRCLLDEVREEALTRQVALEKNLKDRIFDVLEDLATGYRDQVGNKITPVDLPAVYETALVFLYRLLFILYAESRALLPVRASGPGSNKLYRERYSLTRLTSDLRDTGKYDSDAFTDLYEQLLKLFDLINGTHPERNKATDVTRYNGGLFSPAGHLRVDQWRVGDKTLANVLRLLIFDQPAGTNRRQRTIRTNETIDYYTLEVRQLGDIYEGLLGAQLRENAEGRLELFDENGKNHRHGVFYTPDWIVLYLLRETLDPLLEEIDRSEDVRRALAKKNEEQKRDNSFALAVLRLRVVDPAMGSGHFLVRGTEYLARKIREHDTTRLMTEQIVANGPGRRSRAEILKSGRHPVPPGTSQEQAEAAYWRRRVVESCIHGVDLNPMAVELAKLSLWLTCIAIDEPLNFLDHHLRHGNSLVFAEPSHLQHLPTASEEERKQATFTLGDRLPAALHAVIQANSVIEETASTAMEEVKAKEDAWKKVRRQLQPFLNLADLWIAASDGLEFAEKADAPPRTLNELDYQTCARALVAPDEQAKLSAKERTAAAVLWTALESPLGARRDALQPFHWELEFPAVFYTDNGTPLSDSRRGFDAVLGNPPYVSTQTSSAEAWRLALERRDGWLDDFYVHFTELGFRLLRQDGGFGFIVSDTFFTLGTKLRMRELLQRHRLTHLGQCDPFDATVDAAIFVARKAPPLPDEDHSLLFVQARLRPNISHEDIERALGALPPANAVPFIEITSLPQGFGEVKHGLHSAPGRQPGDLRVHRAPLALYRATHKRAFFEPRPGTLRLWEKYNGHVRALVEEWWECIKDSKSFAKNCEAITKYQRKLKPGDVTLIGLIAEGGQGMRTANNGRFLAYLEDTRQANVIVAKRGQWTKRWVDDPKISVVFTKLLLDAGGDPAKPMKDGAAWEATVEPLRQKFGDTALGIGKTDLYRIASPKLVADQTDFDFTWKQRKAALLERWQTHSELKPFWHTTLGLDLSRTQLEKLHSAQTLLDKEFFVLCRQIQIWAAGGTDGKRRASREALDLRNGEDYTEASDAPRIATIYNGLYGLGQFVPYRKGDPDGNQWLTDEPLLIRWTNDDVSWLFDHSGRTESRMPVIRNAHLYFTAGVTYSLHGNHVPVKARLQEPCVFDAGGSRLTPPPEILAANAFLAVLNSNVFSFYLKRFIKHNQDVEINDLRMMPLVLPTVVQACRLERLAELALQAKRHQLAGTHPDNTLVAEIRAFERELFANGPVYLHPGAQMKMLETATDCLGILERAVSWEAEKLYGVEGLGPFDEF